MVMKNKVKERYYERNIEQILDNSHNFYILNREKIKDFNRKNLVYKTKYFQEQYHRSKKNAARNGIKINKS